VVVINILCLYFAMKYLLAKMIVATERLVEVGFTVIVFFRCKTLTLDLMFNSFCAFVFLPPTSHDDWNRW
jgi:ABC-type arginine transport system permease subunit